MTPTPFNVGVFVLGAPTSPRALVRHADLFAAYADGTMAERGEDREAYLSLFAFGEEPGQSTGVGQGGGQVGAVDVQHQPTAVARPSEPGRTTVISLVMLLQFRPKLVV